jgi:hypothetical protein
MLVRIFGVSIITMCTLVCICVFISIYVYMTLVLGMIVSQECHIFSVL